MATAYPVLLMVAQGNHASGYQGVVRLVHSVDDRRGQDLITCGHAHRMTRAARECARRLAGEVKRTQLATPEHVQEIGRRTWDDWKEDR